MKARSWIAAVAGLLMAPPAAAQNLQVLAATVIADEGRFRFELALSAEAPFRATIAPASNLLAIDLLAAPVDSKICAGLTEAPEIAGCSAGRVLFGYTRIAIHLTRCAVLDQAVMAAPIAGEPAMLVIDVIPASALAACVIAPR